MSLVPKNGVESTMEVHISKLSRIGTLNRKEKQNKKKRMNQKNFLISTLDFRKPLD
jgi:hypothetical protein